MYRKLDVSGSNFPCHEVINKIDIIINAIELKRNREKLEWFEEKKKEYKKKFLRKPRLFTEEEINQKWKYDSDFWSSYSPKYYIFDRHNRDIENLNKIRRHAVNCQELNLTNEKVFLTVEDSDYVFNYKV